MLLFTVKFNKIKLLHTAENEYSDLNAAEHLCAFENLPNFAGWSSPVPNILSLALVLLILCVNPVGGTYYDLLKKKNHNKPVCAFPTVLQKELNVTFNLIFGVF